MSQLVGARLYTPLDCTRPSCPAHRMRAAVSRCIAWQVASELAAELEPPWLAAESRACAHVRWAGGLVRSCGLRSSRGTSGSSRQRTATEQVCSDCRRCSTARQRRQREAGRSGQEAGGSGALGQCLGQEPRSGLMHQGCAIAVPSTARRGTRPAPPPQAKPGRLGLKGKWPGAWHRVVQEPCAQGNSTLCRVLLASYESTVALRAYHASSPS